MNKHQKDEIDKDENGHVKTTVRMPKALHRTVKARAASLDLSLEKVNNGLLQMWLKRAPGRVHVDIRPDGDIVMMTAEEIEEDLQKLRDQKKKKISTSQ